MRLHINIDHVATLRNQRDTNYPHPLQAAKWCLDAGADGITVHLREDRRHIRDADVEALCREKMGLVNLEMAANGEMAAMLDRLVPGVVTLVPEKREERTTEGGLDVIQGASAITEVADVCHRRGIKLSLFIEASEEQVRASKELGAQQVEFHTGHYCDAPEEQRPALLAPLAKACRLASELGLEVAAGHGLNCDNVGPIAALPELQELNIGHSVISDAIFVGLRQAVINLRTAIDRARGTVAH